VVANDNTSQFLLELLTQKLESSVQDSAKFLAELQ
jgi:hypothetical protein